MNESMTMAAPAGKGNPPIVDAGSSAGPNKHLEIVVHGMTCGGRAATVEQAVNAVAGVRATHVDLANGRASVDYDPMRVETSKSE